MLIRTFIALMMVGSAVGHPQSCEHARVVSSAELSEEGQAAGALYQKPACQRIRVPDLKNVFVAQVARIESLDGELNLDGKCVKTLLQTVHMRVKERLVGDVGPEAVVSAGDLNGYYFKTGKVYLVYAGGLENGTLHVSGHGQTKLLSEAAEDLAYIRSYASRPPGGEIYGRAWQADNESVAKKMVAWPVKPMKGLRVALQGKTRQEAVIGSDGNYKIGDLPPGKYLVSIDEKSAVWPAASQAVEVVDRGCAEVNFNVDPFHTQDGALIKPKP